MKEGNKTKKKQRHQIKTSKDDKKEHTLVEMNKKTPPSNDCEAAKIAIMAMSEANRL